MRFYSHFQPLHAVRQSVVSDLGLCLRPAARQPPRPSDLGHRLAELPRAAGDDLPEDDAAEDDEDAVQEEAPGDEALGACTMPYPRWNLYSLARRPCGDSVVHSQDLLVEVELTEHVLVRFDGRLRRGIEGL